MVDSRWINQYNSIMKNEIAAKKLAELGHITRLSIFKYLVKVGDQGAPVGQIQEELDVPGSTLSHHISRLVSVGLIKQVRESRILYCIPQFDVLNELIEFLKSECCTVYPYLAVSCYHNTDCCSCEYVWGFKTYKACF